MERVNSAIAAWGARPRAARLARLSSTHEELGGLLRDADVNLLARRPAPEAWAAVEVLCHLRDLEESFAERLTLILTTDEPRFPTTHPARWARERQYLRQDARAATRVFGARRSATLALFSGLGSDAWQRAGYQVDSRGRRTVEDFLTVMAWHDENHLAQLQRALAGKP